jgi:hypothetical protein
MPIVLNMNFLMADLRDLAAELKAESKARQKANAQAAANPPQIVVVRSRGGFDALCSLYYWIILLGIIGFALFWVIIFFMVLANGTHIF